MRNLAKVLVLIFLAGSVAGCVSYGGGSYGQGGYGYGPSYGYGGGYYDNQHYNGNWQHQGNGQALNWQARQQYNIHRQ